MPIKDPDRKKEVVKAWRTRVMAEGYGKALYARRAQRFRNEEILREAVSKALLALAEPRIDKAITILTKALEDAPPIGKPIEYMPKEEK